MDFEQIMCPQYKDSACCNSVQNQFMQFQFELLCALLPTGVCAPCRAVRCAPVYKLWRGRVCASVSVVCGGGGGGVPAAW